MSQFNEYKVVIERTTNDKITDLMSRNISSIKLDTVSITCTVTATSEKEAVTCALKRASSETRAPYNASDEDLDHETSDVDYAVKRSLEHQIPYYLMKGSYFFRVAEVYKLPLSEVVENQYSINANIIDTKEDPEQLKPFAITINSFARLRTMVEEGDYTHEKSNMAHVLSINVSAKSALDAIKLAFSNLHNIIGNSNQMDLALLEQTIDRQDRLSSSFVIEHDDKIFVVAKLDEIEKVAKIQKGAF